MIRHTRRVGRLPAKAAPTAPRPLGARIEPGALVRIDVMLSTLPPRSVYPQAHELVWPHTGRLSTMTAFVVDGRQPF